MRCRSLPILRSRGFTIAEVMMAAAIMALAITTSITTMQQAFGALDTARNLTTAGQIMQSELEKMRLKDWTVIRDYAEGPTALPVEGVFSDNASIGTRFTLRRSVAMPDPNTRQITLSIAWRSHDGRTLTRSYTTLYCRYGLYDYFYNNSSS